MNILKLKHVQSLVILTAAGSLIACGSSSGGDDDDVPGDYVGTWVQECAPSNWEMTPPSKGELQAAILDPYYATSWRMREVTIEKDGGFTIVGTGYSDDTCETEIGEEDNSVDEGKITFAKSITIGDLDGFKVDIKIGDEAVSQIISEVVDNEEDPEFFYLGEDDHPDAEQDDDGRPAEFSEYPFEKQD